jgi:pimeloyl-ACP methyl ester carboxylesterase
VLKAFDSGRLFGAVHGPADPATSPAPQVLALHGWRRTSADFDATLAPLGVPSIAVDLPGFGASPAPPEPWGSTEYAAALDPILALADGPLVVIGHSFGGRVAVRLAARRPDAVRALVLTGVPLVRTTAPKPPPPGYRAARWLHRRGLLPDAQMDRLRQRYGSPDYKAATGVLRDVFVTLVNEDYADDLRAIACPTDLLWGDDDAEVPPVVAHAAAALLGYGAAGAAGPDATPARAQVTLLPGAGHLTPLTAPDALRAALERHLVGT